MKKIHLFTLISAVAASMVSSSFGTTSTYTNVVLSDTPVAFWPLNETSVAPAVPALLTLASSSAGQFQLWITGATNQNYTLQVSTDLGSDWVSLLITNSSSNTKILVTDPETTNE